VSKRFFKRVLLLSAVATCALAFAGVASASTYIVLYAQPAVPASAANDMQKAGGTLVASYDQIGVVIAKSDSSTFRDSLMKEVRIEGVSATDKFGYRLPNDPGSNDGASGPPPGDLPNSPASDTDTLSPLQWDMRQIHAPDAHAITGGSSAVLVGDIDTGIDFTHPDLQPNIDVANSANCVSGAPVAGTAAQDDNGHGTHTAGIIAAASNGFGIVGVAPNVKIAGIKAGNAAGFFFPEAVVCAFVWAGSHHVDVTNNSYFADPFLFNCHNDPVQQAIWKAEYRAIRYAETQGVTVVAAEGNESDDLTHPTQDVTSPDDTTPVVRPISNDCVVIPVEVPGVIGVTADGHNQQVDDNASSDPDYLKSFYSSYGMGVTDVVAPGGDSIFGTNAEAPNGRVLSTWPFALQSSCLASRRVFEVGHPGVMWCYQQGTSMASPHAAGVAALVISRFGNLQNPQNGKMRPGAVEQFVEQTADPQPCPTTLPTGYEAFTSVSNGAPQQCNGNIGYNSWYGNGQVNALRAITNDRSQSTG
jgi:lantibiotic leader peptide-processing serine protease